MSDMQIIRYELRGSGCWRFPIAMIRLPTIFISLLCLTGLSPVAGQQRIHEGSLQGFKNSGPLAVSVSKDETVQYGIQLSSNYIYGASVLVRGFNPEGKELFRLSPYVPRTGKYVTLPAGIGHLVPYRGTLHEVGRPSYLVIESLNEQVSYEVWETKVDRQEYNRGGRKREEAVAITLYEQIKGNVHELEGNETMPGDLGSPGGQWYKVTLEPRQTIRPYGWALGHPQWGAAFKICLYDESGNGLPTLLSISAYGNVSFPGASGTYLYQNTATEPKVVYLQVFSAVGIVHDFEFSLVEVKMEFVIKSQTINKQNKYSEDSTVEVQAIRGDTRAPLTDFSGNVYIAEINGNTYTQNGGFLPPTVQIPSGAGGKAEFVAKSLVGPRNDEPDKRKPLPAEIRCANFRQSLSGAPADDRPLEIEQWFYTSNSRLDDRSTGEVPDWLQARMKDLFGRLDLTGADRAALDAVKSYTIADLGDNDGAVPISLSPTLPLKLSPFKNSGMRLNQLWWVGTCGPMVQRRYLTSILFHEARHCYQGSQASQIEKNKDKDFLINAPYEHAPTDAPVDSTTSRFVCNDSGMIVPDWAYHDDSVPDKLGPLDQSDWGLEFDAYWFQTIQRPY